MTLVVAKNSYDTRRWPNAKGSASTIFSRDPAANVGHAQTLVDTLRSHNPSLIGLQEPPRPLEPMVDCLRRLLLRFEPWIQRCHLTTVTLADRPETSYRRWLRLPSARTIHIAAPLQR